MPLTREDGVTALGCRMFVSPELEVLDPTTAGGGDRPRVLAERISVRCPLGTFALPKGAATLPTAGLLSLPTLGDGMRNAAAACAPPIVALDTHPSGKELLTALLACEDIGEVPLI